MTEANSVTTRNGNIATGSNRIGLARVIFQHRPQLFQHTHIIKRALNLLKIDALDLSLLRPLCVVGTRFGLLASRARMRAAEAASTAAGPRQEKGP